MWNKQHWLTEHIFWIFNTPIAATWGWWEKSLLYLSSATQREKLSGFAGAGHPIFLFRPSDIARVPGFPSRPGAETLPSRCRHSIRASREKSASLLSGANGMPCAPTSICSCGWEIKMEIGELKLKFWAPSLATLNFPWRQAAWSSAWMASSHLSPPAAAAAGWKMCLKLNLFLFF